MKKIMMKYLMISCKEATYLTGLKEEQRLSFVGKAKLSLHTSMCAVCKKFEEQTARIARESKHIQAEEQLPAQTKERIEQFINKHSS